jgi:hypothetical protein
MRASIAAGNEGSLRVSGRQEGQIDVTGRKTGFVPSGYDQKMADGPFAGSDRAAFQVGERAGCGRGGHQQGGGCARRSRRRDMTLALTPAARAKANGASPTPPQSMAPAFRASSSGAAAANMVHSIMGSMPANTPDAVINDLAPPFWSPTRGTGDAMPMRERAKNKPAATGANWRRVSAAADGAGFILIYDIVEPVFTSCCIVEYGSPQRVNRCIA